MKCLVSPLFLLLATCFSDMISRETLFTIMYKNTKNVFVFVLFLICMIWSCFYGFLLITFAPNVCSIYVPNFSLICHRAVRVRWLYKWLDKPIKTFCYKKTPRHICWDKVNELKGSWCQDSKWEWVFSYWDVFSAFSRLLDTIHYNIKCSYVTICQTFILNSYTTFTHLNFYGNSHTAA